MACNGQVTGRALGRRAFLHGTMVGGLAAVVPARWLRAARCRQPALPAEHAAGPAVSAGPAPRNETDRPRPAAYLDEPARASLITRCAAQVCNPAVSAAARSGSPNAFAFGFRFSALDRWQRPSKAVMLEGTSGPGAAEGLSTRSPLKALRPGGPAPNGPARWQNGRGQVAPPASDPIGHTWMSLGHTFPLCSDSPRGGA